MKTGLEVKGAAMSEAKDIKTKSDLMDSFVQIAIAKGYSDYDGEAARFINETVDMYSNLPRPQLTIPKSIAEILGKYDEYSPTADKLIMMAYRDYQEFHDWLNEEWVKNDNISRAYLAGKALGVDLVKVGEG